MARLEFVQHEQSLNKPAKTVLGLAALLVLSLAIEDVRSFIGFHLSDIADWCDNSAAERKATGRDGLCQLADEFLVVSDEHLKELQETRPSPTKMVEK